MDAGLTDSPSAGARARRSIAFVEPLLDPALLRHGAPVLIRHPASMRGCQALGAIRSARNGPVNAASPARDLAEVWSDLQKLGAAG